MREDGLRAPGPEVVAQQRAVGGVDLREIHAALAVRPEVFQHPRGDPAAPLQRVLDVDPGAVVAPARRRVRDRLAVHHDLQPVVGQLRLGRRVNRYHARLPALQLERLAGLAAVHRERQHRAVGDERAAPPQSVDPRLVGELALHLREDPVGADGDERGHLVGAGGGRQPEAAIEVAVPQAQAVVGLRPPEPPAA